MDALKEIQITQAVTIEKLDTRAKDHDETVRLTEKVARLEKLVYGAFGVAVTTLIIAGIEAFLILNR